MKHGIITLVVFLLAGGVLLAQQTVGTSQVISYQGAVGSIDGFPLVDGEYSITVTLYADAGGAVRVWRDTYVTPVRSGIFNIYLGSGAVPLPPPGQMDKALWIGTQIAGGDEMRPLMRLSASPYAINVPDAAITTSKLADGAVTEEKVGMDYISGVSVNGKKVAISGKVLNIQAGKDIDIHYDDVSQSLIIGSPAETGAGGEKENAHGRRLQGTPQDAWTMQGNGVSVPGAAAVVPNNNDYIGTNNAADFNIRVNATQAMRYQPNGGVTPSIIGGYLANTSALGGTGNTIAGGGGPLLANTIDGIQYNVISGGADNHVYNANASFGVVAGGQENTIGTAATLVNYGVIGGGLLNQVTATYGTIGGGNRSAVSGVNSTVGGGIGNIISGSEATIAGGDGNQVSRQDGAIAGGYHNQIIGSADYGTIAGGHSNVINSEYDFVGGGQTNTIAGPWGVINGGLGNNVLNAGSAFGVIAGGQWNQIGTAAALANYGVIGGGLQNQVTATYGTIGGGNRSVVSAVNSTVGGGIGNLVSGSEATIAGGDGNQISRRDGAIAGGYHNQIIGSADYGTIAGGNTNIINGEHDFVGGGQANSIAGPWGVINGGLGNNVLNAGSAFGVIAGGQWNQIGTAAALANYGVIGGGLQNQVTATYGTIGGGNRSAVSGVNSTVGGGIGNLISGSEATIAGGDGNQISTLRGSIGGGYHNTINGAGFSATIPGGENLTAQSYGQTVVGVLNIPKGTVLPGGAPNDQPIFIVGNGILGSPSNAFEVSYNGHSTVFQNTGGVTPSVFGGTFADNVILSWGSVDATGGRVCDFGVANVTHLGTGWYQIDMNVVDPDGNPLLIGCGSVTATISDMTPPGSPNFNCAVISVSLIQNSRFDVHIMDTKCGAVDQGFNFKVTGRP